MDDDKRDRLNMLGPFSGELTHDEIPFDERHKLIGLERVETWQPRRVSYGIKPALIILGFLLFVFTLARLWIWMFIPLIASLVTFLLFYFNPMTLCPRCKKEMNYYRPITSGIKYDWCKKCKCYSNVRWIPQGGD